MKKPVKGPARRRESNEEFLAARTRSIKVFEAAAAELLDAIAATDGMEIHGHQWELAELLASRGQITLGPARGPSGAFRRAEIVKAPVDLTHGLGHDVHMQTAMRMFAEPVPPPVTGVEPAPAFAVRLARQLCVGDPLMSFVVEIIQAVRKRDAAIVQAKDDEAYAVSMRAATRSTR